MKLTIKIMQRGKKVKEIEAHLPEETDLEVARKIWEAEQMMNSLPTDLRWHFHIEE